MTGNAITNYALMGKCILYPGSVRGMTFITFDRRYNMHRPLAPGDDIVVTTAAGANSLSMINNQYTPGTARGMTGTATTGRWNMTGIFSRCL